MALSYSKISLKDVSRGIDARAAQNAIEPGFAEDLLNCDTNASGYISKRRGYQGYSGWLPYRVTDVVHSGTEIKFYFDSTINLLSKDIGPIVVYGRLGDPSASPGSTDFVVGTDNARYYSTYSVDARNLIQSGIVNNLAVQHNLGTTNILIGAAISTDPSALSSNFYYPDTMTVDSTTGTFSIDASEETTDFYSFFFFGDKSTSVGSSYAADYVIADFVGNILTIPAGTHQLTNVNVIPQLYQDLTGSYEHILPDRFEIMSNGDIEIELSTPVDLKVVLSDVSGSLTSEVGVLSGVPMSVSLTPLSGAVFFVAAYIRDNTGNRQLAIVDSIVYDASTNLLSVDVTPSFDGILQIVYEPATLQANYISVTDTTGNSATYTDSKPQLTLWGIGHENAYSTSVYGGHVTHIDSYKRELESRVVAGLGGNFYASRTIDEIGSEYLLPSTQISLSERVGTAKYIGPVFWNTDDSPSITRAVQGDNVDNNRAYVSAATFTGTDGEVKLSLNIVNKSGLLSGISTEDLVDVSGMAFAVLNGQFAVLATSDVDNSITVSIPAITTSDFDEVGAQGQLGVFTDIITLQNNSPFVEGDQLLSNLFTSTMTPVVQLVDGMDVIVSGVTSEVMLPSALLLRGERTSDTHPVVSVENFVPGDMCYVSGISQEVRVVSINTSTNTLTFDESLTLAHSDGDATVVGVSSRWIPIEAPVSSGTQPQDTYTYYFDSNSYDEQPIVRSGMVSNSLYYTNGADEVMKFDGTSLYKAGLPRWQPHLFASLVTTGSDSILMPNAIAKVSTIIGSSTDTIDVDVGELFTRGQLLVINGSVYTVTQVNLDASQDQIFVSPNIASAAVGDAIRPLRQLRYYFRLNAKDRNQNIVASAAVGSNDFIINLTSDANVSLKLVGLPSFGAYDYDTLEVKIFRADFGVNDFREIATIRMPQNQYDGYITYTDISQLDSTDTANKDDTTDLLTPGELGTRWDEPLRAKYVTAVNNALALANLRDYPELDVVLRRSTGVAITDANLSDKRFLLLKDYTDGSTTTNMVDRAGYRFVYNGQKTVLSVADNGGFAQVTLDGATPLSGIPAAGSWIYLFHAAVGADKDLTYSGWHQVRSDIGNSTTIITLATVYVATAAVPNRMAAASTLSDIPVWLGTDGNYNTVSGNSTLSSERLAMIRLANAINSTMRVTDRTITGQEDFMPWVIARAGDEIGLGQLVLRQPNADSAVIGLLAPTNPTNGALYVNDNAVSSAAIYAARERKMPNRVILSYKAPYNEIFNGPFGLAEDSQLVFDVDPSDGQEINGIINFFGVAPFAGGAQREDMLVVFKSNSIHVINTSSKEIKKLETQQIGCTSPYSIAYTRNGINFIYQSGIYRLDKDLNVTYLGEYLERLWQDNVQSNDLSRATGSHYAQGRQYKVSVPYGQQLSNSDNNSVLVYDYGRETEPNASYGAWSRYDNHPVTGWANLQYDSYFGSTTGDVFKLRNLGDKTDYRDDDAPISQEVTLGALDFGIPGVSKVVKSVSAHYQLRFSDLTGGEVSASVDLDNVFQDMDSFTITQDQNISGLDGTVKRKMKTLVYTLPRRVLEYLQLKFTNATKDEDMTLAGVTVDVATRSTATLPTAGNNGR